MNYYERLDVSPAASEVELRQAFRIAARDAHPDRHGDASSALMAEINQAWAVLGNPLRRRVYDELLVLIAANSMAPASVASATVPSSPVASARPRRSRWRFVLSMEMVALALVVALALHTSSPQLIPDGVLRTGDCVALTADQRRPIEVSCAGKFDAVVERLIPFGQVCPDDTLPSRIRTARVCVVPVSDGATALP